MRTGRRAANTAAAFLMSVIMLVPCYFVNRAWQFAAAELSAGLLRRTGIEDAMKQHPIEFTRIDPADYPSDGRTVLAKLTDAPAAIPSAEQSTESIRACELLTARFGEPDSKPPFGVRYGFTLKAVRFGEHCLLFAAEWKGVPVILGTDSAFSAEAADALSEELLGEQK